MLLRRGLGWGQRWVPALCGLGQRQLGRHWDRASEEGARSLALRDTAPMGLSCLALEVHLLREEGGVPDALLPSPEAPAAAVERHPAGGHAPVHRPRGPGPAAGITAEPEGARRPGGSQPEGVPVPPALGPAELCLPFPHRWTCSIAVCCKNWHPSRPGAAGWGGPHSVLQSLVPTPAPCVWTTFATSRLVP